MPLVNARNVKADSTGNMGSSLLRGLLDAVSPKEVQNGSTDKAVRFIACTNSEESARALETSFIGHGCSLSIRYRQNIEVIKEADVIVLGFKPYLAKKILDDPGVRRNVSGKLVVSLLAGLSAQDIRNCILDCEGMSGSSEFWVAKAIPNLAARYRLSMTIIEQPPTQFPSRHLDFLNWMFGLVGKIKFLNDSLVDVGSVLVTTCLASLTVPLDGILDGAVVEGFKRQDALDLAAQSVVCLGSLLSHGTHPAPLREQISSPKGCTIQSLVAVERGGARATFTNALLQGTEHLRKP